MSASPHEPKKHITSFLGPLVRVLFWNVVIRMRQFVPCVLICISSDTTKAAGFLGHHANNLHASNHFLKLAIVYIIVDLIVTHGLKELIASIAICINIFSFKHKGRLKHLVAFSITEIDCDLWMMVFVMLFLLEC